MALVQLAYIWKHWADVLTTREFIVWFPKVSHSYWSAKIIDILGMYTKCLIYDPYVSSPIFVYSNYKKLFHFTVRLLNYCFLTSQEVIMCSVKITTHCNKQLCWHRFNDFVTNIKLHCRQNSKQLFLNKFWINAHHISSFLVTAWSIYELNTDN